MEKMQRQQKADLENDIRKMIEAELADEDKAVNEADTLFMSAKACGDAIDRFLEATFKRIWLERILRRMEGLDMGKAVLLVRYTAYYLCKENGDGGNGMKMRRSLACMLNGLVDRYEERMEKEVA